MFGVVFAFLGICACERKRLCASAGALLVVCSASLLLSDLRLLRFGDLGLKLKCVLFRI